MIDLAVNELGECGQATLRWKWQHYLGYLPTSLSLWIRRHSWMRGKKHWALLSEDLEYDGRNGKEISVELDAGEWELVIAPTRISSENENKIESLTSNIVRISMSYDGIGHELPT